MMGLPQGVVTFTSALSATVLNALWEDALLVISIWLVLRLWPRTNAATRYTVWSATLVAALVIPVATTLAFFAPPHQAVAVSTRESVPAERHRALPAHSAAEYNPKHEMTLPAAASPVTERLPQRVRVTIPLWLNLAVFSVWVLLAGYAVVKLLLGLVRLEQLKRDALPLSVEYRDAMPQWLRANKGARDVRLCVSDDTDVPVAVGLFDAMILVPHSLLDRLSEGEVDQICLHELAHLRRADDWSNGFQRLIIALLAWNPAAQFVGQQLDLEREVACDDWVLSFVGMVRPYALCLTKMAERATWPRHPIPAPGVFATRKHISLRIERLLGAGRNIATNLSPAPTVAAIAAAATLALAITVVAPSVAAPEVAVPPQTAAAPLPAVPAKHLATAVPAQHLATAPPRLDAHHVESSKQIEGSKEVEVFKQVKVSKPAALAQPKTKTATVPATTAGQIVIPRTVIPRTVIPETVLPRVVVPGVDSKHLTDTITNNVMGQVKQNVATAVGAARLAVTRENCSGCDYRRVDWSGRDMHGVNYIGVDLSDAKLIGTNFSGGSFNGVDFSKSNLRNASFRNAHMTGCDFSGADLTAVDFSGARISGCQFTGAQLTSASLRDVLNSCTGCDFSRAHLAGLDLSNVRASGDDFSAADLRDVNSSSSQLTGIDFSGARMAGVNLSGATLNRVLPGRRRSHARRSLEDQDDRHRSFEPAKPTVI